MSYKYIPWIPQPLLNDFVKNRVVPFVGAGFSKNADIPKDFSMPDWNELGKLAAAEIKDYEYENNPIDALSYYESLYKRPKLIEFLIRVLNDRRIKPGDTYEEFCKLFTGTICTTNYDFLLEEEMNLLNRPFSTIVTEDRLTINAPDENRILKLHGDFNHPDKMVITEEDYDLYLERNPVFATYVSNLFINNTMFLIGYSLEDADFRGIWQIINNRLGGMTQPVYCVLVGASEALKERYRRRKISVIDLPGEAKDYKEILRILFSEINDYVSKEKDRTAKSKDDRINEQLLIPSDSNKLCFVSCTTDRIAQLSSLLYPILRNQGVTPIRIDDMLMPGDNWLNVARTVIRKSNLAIVDVSDDSPYVAAELSMLVEEKKKVLVICDSSVKKLPACASNYIILRYTFDPVNGNNIRFREEISKWIEKYIDIKIEKKDSNTSIFENANRLFQKEEYSSCIVSAYSDFVYLVKTLQNDSCIKDKRNLDYQTRTDIFETLFRENKVDKSELDDLKRVRTIRNRIVHTTYNATKKEAKNALALLSEILIRLK